MSSRARLIIDALEVVLDEHWDDNTRNKYYLRWRSQETWFPISSPEQEQAKPSSQETEQKQPKRMEAEQANLMATEQEQHKPMETRQEPRWLAKPQEDGWPQGQAPLPKAYLKRYIWSARDAFADPYASFQL